MEKRAKRLIAAERESVREREAVCICILAERVKLAEQIAALARESGGDMRD